MFNMSNVALYSSSCRADNFRVQHEQKQKNENSRGWNTVLSIGVPTRTVADLTVGGLGGRLGPRRFRGPVDQ